MARFHADLYLQPSGERPASAQTAFRQINPDCPADTGRMTGLLCRPLAVFCYTEVFFVRYLPGDGYMKKPGNIELLDGGMDFTIATKLFAALFAIMNPLSSLPLFLALTADLSQQERRSAMFSMLATIVIGSIVCAIAGQALLSMFGIDVQNFRLAGGLIVLLIALNMLNGGDHSSHHGTDKEQGSYQAGASAGVYPLGIPLTFGPGTIATLVIFAHATDTRAGILGYYAGLGGYLVFFGVLLFLAPRISPWLSPMALSISKRIMGMILAAIAMEMMTAGLGQIFPGWRVG